jgi:hypothetical protein
VAGNQRTLEVEGVVGGGMHRDKALGGTWRLEALHLTLAPANRLMGDLGPIVLESALVMLGAQADLLERSAIRAQLVGRHPSGREAVLPEQLADELPGRGFVLPAPDQDLQHLTLVIDRHRYTCRLWIRTTILSKGPPQSRGRYAEKP